MSIKLKIKQNIPLAPLTTFKIGGPAEYFFEAEEKEELEDAFRWAKKNKKEVTVLAGGSNVLINDKGIDGLVIKMNNKMINVRGARLDCGAGASLSRAVRLAVSNNLSGLEWAMGIPGATIGGAIRGNAGAFGFSIGELAETVEVFNIKRRKFELFSNKNCKFNYRESIFKKNFNYLIWNVVLKMNKGNSNKTKSLVEKNFISRSKTQPKLPSAGCVFKNLSITNLREFNTKLADLAENEKVVKGGKVGAGWLIDLIGLKGRAVGGAKISLEHANFIINTGKATAEDVITLISLIKQQIRDRFRVQLFEEIQYLGF